MTYDIQFERAKALASIAARNKAKEHARKRRAAVLSMLLVILLCAFFSAAWVAFKGA